MSNKLLATATAFGIVALGLGQAPAKAGDGNADAATLIGARQSALMLSAVAFGGMKATIDSGGDVSSQAFAARALARWGRTLPTLFPAGTGKASGTPTKALDTIWSDRAGFEARAAEYAAATARLAHLAEANDKPGFAAQWQVVRQSCSGCHDTFREAPPGPRGRPDAARDQVTAAMTGDGVSGLPMSQGQSFRTLDDYLAYRATLGAFDAPYYTEIKPGLYELWGGRRPPGVTPPTFTRAQLLEEFGFSE